MCGLRPDFIRTRTCISASMALSEGFEGRGLLKIKFWFHLTYSTLLSAVGLYLNATDYDKFDDSRVKLYEYLRFRLLTIWFHFLLLAYFPVAAYCDWRALRGAAPRHVRLLEDACQTVFTALILPTTWYVDSFFWRIWYLNRELIVPSYLDVLVTPDLQHVFHSLSLLAVTVELLLVDWRRPNTMFWHHFILSLYLVAYTAVVIETKVSRGIWPYPFLADFLGSHTARFLYIVSYVVEHYFFFHLQWLIIQLRWRYKKNSKNK